MELPDLPAFPDGPWAGETWWHQTMMKEYGKACYLKALQDMISKAKQMGWAMKNEDQFEDAVKEISVLL